MTKQLKVTQVTAAASGHPPPARVLKTLGLRKIRQSVVREGWPQRARPIDCHGAPPGTREEVWMADTESAEERCASSNCTTCVPPGAQRPRPAWVGEASKVSAPVAVPGHQRLLNRPWTGTRGFLCVFKLRGFPQANAGSSSSL